MAQAISINSGCSLEYTNGTGQDIPSKSVVVVGSIVGIAAGKILDGETGIVITEGVWQLDKDAPLAITIGDKLYWNTTDKEVTKTVTDKPIGIAAASAASADTRVNVLLYDCGNGCGAVAATVAAITTANGSDAGTTQTLANQLKTSFNDLLAKLKAAGIVAS